MALSADKEVSKRQKFVIENNILKGSLEPVDSDRKLGPIILDIFNKYPDHVAQIDAETGEQTTNEEMKENSIRCALWLKKRGIGPNDIVVACTHNHLDSYVPLIATLFVDAIFNAWNYDITIDAARRYMKLFKPKVIFTCEKAVEVLQEASQLEKVNVEFVVFGNHSTLPTLMNIMNSQTQEEIGNFAVVNVKSPDEVALIILSSGTTGFRKGVIKSNKMYLSALLKQHCFTDTTPRFMWYSSLDWISCISFTLQAIVTKQTRIIPTSSDLEDVFQTIEKYKVNRVFFPLKLIPYIADSHLVQKYDLRSLNTIIIGGSKYSKAVLESLKQKIPTAFVFHIYASTEVGTIFISTPACKHVESVGFIDSNAQAKFVDLETGKNLGPNLHGEICVKSPIVTTGYFNNPEATREAFDDNGWYHTGDIGYYDETGEIFMVDRIKELIKFRNFLISPIQIEEVLLSHPDILEAVVVALPHELDGNWPTAFCKKVPGSNVTEDDLMKLTAVLEDRKKLRGGIHFLENFLYTSGGKIARNEMKLLAQKLEAVNFLIEDNIMKGAVRSLDVERKVGQVILDALNGDPDHVSQIDAETGEQTTYGEMKDRSIRCALWLKKQEISPNDIIVACTDRQTDAYIPFFATFFVDAIFTAWYYNMTIHTARRYLQQFTPKVIFVSEKAVDVLLEASKLENINVKLVVFGENSRLPSLIDIMNEQSQEDVDNFTIVNIKSPNDLAIMTLSSGSTGLPKGVMHSNKALLAKAMIASNVLEPMKVLLWNWQLNWEICTTYILETIIMKQTRIIPTHWDVDNLLRVIEKYKVDWAFFQSNLVAHAAKSDLSKSYDLNNLKAIFLAGRKYGENDLKALQRSIPNAFIQYLYGTTETGHICVRTPMCKHIHSIGFVCTNVEMKFVDLATGKSVGPNQEGEIYVQSPGTMMGYYNNPEATNQDLDEDGWYHTGDIGYYEETGEIFIIDRIKQLMKFQGQHIYPAEIEEILLSHPEIEEAVVVGLPHKLNGDLIMSFCKKAPKSKVTEDELMELTSILEDYKKLRGGICFIENFPYTSSGKIARNEVKLLARDMVKIEDES